MNVSAADWIFIETIAPYKGYPLAYVRLRDVTAVKDSTDQRDQDGCHIHCGPHVFFSKESRFDFMRRATKGISDSAGKQPEQGE